MNIIQLGIDRLTPKTQAQLARLCGVKPQAVTRWLATGKIPPAHVLAFEAATGISRHAARPDIFGSAPAMEARDEAA